MKSNIASPLPVDGSWIRRPRRLRYGHGTERLQPRGGQRGTGRAAAARIGTVAANPDLFVRIRTPADVLAARRAGKIGIIASFESADMMEGKVDAVDAFRARDVLIMSLSYNLQTPFGSGVMEGIPLTLDTSPETMTKWCADIERRKRIGVNAPGEGPSPFVTELNRPDRMEVIAQALARKGYGSSAIEKVLGSNFQRVFAETWIPRA